MQKCIAEAVGTGVIVGGGCTVVSAMKYAGAPIGPLAIALGFGGSVMMAIYATRDISGAHLNPAVTLTLAVNRPEVRAALWQCDSGTRAVVRVLVRVLDVVGVPVVTSE